MSYEANLADVSHLAATYMTRMFKGEKPADLAVQQCTRSNWS